MEVENGFQREFTVCMYGRKGGLLVQWEDHSGELCFSVSCHKPALGSWTEHFSGPPFSLENHRFPQTFILISSPSRILSMQLSGKGKNKLLKTPGIRWLEGGR